MIVRVIISVGFDLYQSILTTRSVQFRIRIKKEKKKKKIFFLLILWNIIKYSPVRLILDMIEYKFIWIADQVVIILLNAGSPFKGDFPDLRNLEIFLSGEIRICSFVPPALLIRLKIKERKILTLFFYSFFFLLND